MALQGTLKVCKVGAPPLKVVGSKMPKRIGLLVNLASTSRSSKLDCLLTIPTGVYSP